jgi:SAM-dependent methyltransferase
MEKRNIFILPPMNLKQAIEFIAFENATSVPQLWLDLGCGTGLFTVALAHYLSAGSKIKAVDKDEKALEQLPALINGVTIETRVADFIQEALDIKGADGILMANSLHYVKAKEIFLNRLVSLLKVNSVFLLVEYDRTRANQWVPYPLAMTAAKDLFKKLGYTDFRVLNKRSSAYGGDMYAVLIS